MSNPWLSVIIPTYNGALHLATALQSIVLQSEPDIECIVVDDGSVDSTRAIVASFAESIPIVLHSVKRSGNWVQNTNMALSLAVGEYVGFLHQDDFWFPERLKILKGLLAEHRDAELLLSPALFVNQDGRPVGAWRCPLPGRTVPVDSGLLLSRLLIQNFIAVPSPLFKREAALEVGGLDESLWYTADWDFWLKLARRSTIFYPKPLAAFRLHADSQTVRRSVDIPEFRHQMETVLHRHWVDLQASGRERERIRRSALFSIEVNTALAARMHGAAIEGGPLIAACLRLGPLGFWRYLHDSRLIERVAARLRTRISSTLPFDTNLR